MGAPSAKEVGSVGIRALPITDNFRRDLLAKLRKIEKSVSFAVNVDRARLDRASFRRSIQEQLLGMRAFSIDVEGKLSGLSEQLADVNRKFELMPSLDRALLERVRREVDTSIRRIEPTLKFRVDSGAVRARVGELESELKTLERHITISVLNEGERVRIRHRINEINDALDDMARNRTVRVDVNPFTAWASARLAWLARTRIVTIIPQVSKVALAKAMTALAALSGARLSFDYLERFSRWIGEVDKKLPSLVFGTTGLATAFSAIMASVSGLVGIGDGLAATLPSLLLLPGLFAGAAMSATALFVALKHSKTELASLGPSYTNLGGIIRKAFWDEARPAIIEFSNFIMPQLERSFRRTSRAIGSFAANLARSFKKSFANGELEAMFSGLAKSWRILATGTDAFAGAVTNLGLVAARYMPRLAKWFVRLSVTFDNWLSDVATDGRLDQWIEESIDAFYALWDVTAATTGIFQGIWKAAEAAGSGGLRGFADMLLRWEEAVQGARWQETLIAFFRGSGVAMDGLADGLDRVGRMFHKQRETIEYFLGTAGESLGSFLGSIADAFGQPEVAEGIERFIDGVASGLKKLEPVMGPLARAFGDLAGFVGDLTDAISGPLATVFGIAADLIGDLAESIEKNDIINRLATAFDEFAKEIAPFLEEVAAAVGDELLPALVNLAEDGLPVLAELVTLLGPTFVGTIGNATDVIDGLAESLEFAKTAWDALWGDESAQNRITSADTEAWVDLAAALDSFTTFAHPVAGLLKDIGLNLENITTWASEIGPAIETGLASLPGVVAVALGRISTALTSGMALAIAGVMSTFANLKSRIDAWFIGAGLWLFNSGKALIDGFAKGVTAGVALAIATVASAIARVRALFPNSPAKIGPFSGRGWVSYSGTAVGETFSKSIASSLDQSRSVVSGGLSRVQSQFSLPLAGAAGSSARASGHVINATFTNPNQRDQFREFESAVERALR